MGDTVEVVQQLIRNRRVNDGTPSSGNEVRATLDAALGDLASSVELVAGQEHVATRSPTDAPLWDSLQRVAGRFYEGSALVPLMMPGATDARFFRTLGATAYGFGLFSTKMSLDDLATTGHGDNERVDVDSLDLCTQMWDALVRDVLA